MELIPVLDLLGGAAVHAVGGTRERYQPVQSRLGDGRLPLDLAHALLSASGARRLYVADLDAITGTGDHLDLLRDLAAGLPSIELWVDAGMHTPEAGRRLLSAGAARVVVGSETLPSLGHLGTLLDVLRPERLLFSLDVAAGRTRSPATRLRDAEPVEAAAILAAQGIEEIIALALDRVGTGAGPPWELLEAVGRAFPPGRVIAGGGVRHDEDVAALARAGIGGALVATALHEGRFGGKRSG